MLRLLASLIFCCFSALANSQTALVELFTSQGCSSCPPAEKLMTGLQQSVDSANAIILSFHVDYWNDLGWKDPFSRPEFAERQRLYKQYGISDGIYTPQLIINGKSAFTGGNGARLAREVTALRQKTFPALIVLNTETLTDGKLKINYTVSGTENECVMNFAIVTSGDTTEVKAGENVGKRLISVNTVRMFSYKLLEGKSGSILMRLPDNVLLADLRLIVYAQNTSGAEVLGVAMKSLEN